MNRCVKTSTYTIISNSKVHHRLNPGGPTTRKTDKTRLDARCHFAWSDMHATGAQRAVTRVRRRAHAYTWAHRVHSSRCTSRVTIIDAYEDISTRRYACCYETDTENCMFSIRSIFDVINTMLKIFLLPIVAFPSSRIITEIIFVRLHYRNPISVNYAGFNLWNEICNAHHAIEKALGQTSNI